MPFFVYLYLKTISIIRLLAHIQTQAQAQTYNQTHTYNHTHNHNQRLMMIPFYAPQTLHPVFGTPHSLLGNKNNIYFFKINHFVI